MKDITELIWTKCFIPATESIKYIGQYSTIMTLNWVNYNIESWDIIESDWDTLRIDRWNRVLTFNI